MVSRISWLITACFTLSACGDFAMDRSDHLVGEKLKEVSGLTSDTGAVVSKVAMYDKTVNRIHQFALGPMKLIRSERVAANNQPHYVLYDQIGEYLIDLTERDITIFDRDGGASKNPVRMPGQPVSAVFRPSAGLLVVYDDLMSVALIKITPTGAIQKAWLGGPALCGGGTISAGDVDGAGRLVFAMSNGNIVLVDVDQSIDNHAWSCQFYPSGVTDTIKWLGRVRDNSDQVLAATNSGVHLLDVSARTTLASRTDLGGVDKFSKSIDPHAIFLEKAKMTIAYARGSAIQTRDFFYVADMILNTRLDVAGDQFSMIHSEGSKRTYLDTPSEFARELVGWRLSDLLATPSVKLPDKATFEMAGRTLFMLYPSKVGRAESFDLLTGVVARKDGYNLPYIQ